MQTLTKILILVVLSSQVSLLHAQDTIQKPNNADKIERLMNAKETVKEEERAFLKAEVEAIDAKREKGYITAEEAEILKKEAARKRALNIQNRISIIDNKIDLLKRNEEGYYTNDEKEPSKIGITIDGEEYSFAGIQINKKRKPRKYDLRTTSDLVLAFGLNNAIIEGENLDNSPYKFGGSRFFEIGWAWKNRVFENTNFLRLKYGVSLQINGLKPDGNHYFVNQDGQISLQEFPENLRKSKLSLTNLVFPVHFEFGPSKRYDHDTYFRYSTENQFKIGLGGYGGFNIGARQKLKYSINGDRKKEKQKGGFNTSNLVYGLSGYVAFDDMAIYVKYDLSPIFQDQAIAQRNISVGVRFDVD